MDSDFSFVEYTDSRFVEYTDSDGRVHYRNVNYDEIVARQPKPAIEDPVQPSAEDDMNWLRLERNRRLASCDWTQGADVPDAIKSAWQPYRQQLRDITNTYTSQLDVVWPEEP